MAFLFGTPPVSKVTATDSSGTQLVNAATANAFAVNLNPSYATNTLANPTGMQLGVKYTWIIQQDASTAVDLSFGTDFLFTGGTSPTITQEAGAVDILRATCLKDSGGNLKMYCSFEADSKLPSSGPTASANLIHWWKMNEGSTTSATDYGLGVESGSALSMSGVTSTSGGGPSAIGSPDYVSTDGVADQIYTYAVDGASRTSVGDVFNNGSAKSVCMWMKIPAITGVEDNYWNLGGDRSKAEGTALFDRGNFSNIWAWFDDWIGGSPVTYSYDNIVYSSHVGTGWVHWAFTYPITGTAKYYINGSLFHTYGSQSGNVDTQIATLPAGRRKYFTLGCAADTVNLGSWSRVAWSWSTASFSDVRLYNKELDATEVAAIAAGDW